MLKRELTSDYIRGLVEGEGSFTFSKNRKSDGAPIRIPSFQIKMHVRDKALLEGIRDYLGLKNNIYVYDYQRNDGHNRAPQAILIVREIGNLKNTVIPFFYDKLAGNKAVQFNEWLGKIRNDPMVPEGYDILYRLHENGYYARNSKFTD
jgi:hypothetical protein